MRELKYKLLVLILLLAVQSQAGKYKVEWAQNERLPASNIEVLSIKDADYSPSNLTVPLQVVHYQFNNVVSDFDVRLINIVSVPLDANEEKLVKGEISNDFLVSKSLGTFKKKSVGEITVATIAKNSNGTYSKLMEFDIEINNIQYSVSSASNKVNSGYRSGSSVLASGKWYKMGISKTGIYKIDKTFLEKIGVSPSSIDPRNIRIYGGLGGMLDEEAKLDYTDVVENAIYVVGQSDGVFNDNDYALFFAHGPDSWSYSATTSMFEHQSNYFVDSNYYFINFDLGAGKRIQSQAQSTDAVTHNVNSFDDYAYVESDQTSLIKTGRRLYGHYFSVSDQDHEFNFSFSNLDVSTPVKVRGRFAIRSFSATNNSLTFYNNGTSFNTISSIGAVIDHYESAYAKIVTTNPASFTATSESINLKIKYGLPTNVSEAWMDYIYLNVRRDLKASSTYIDFRDIESVGGGNVSKFSIESSSDDYQIWDVTDQWNIKSQNFDFTGSSMDFVQNSDTLKEYVLVKGSSFNSPSFSETIANQDIHGAFPVDYVIVSAVPYLNAAEKLADHHRDKSGLDVIVVTPEQVYNEFSSGRKDLSAVRNMMKYFYDSATDSTEEPKYLLLMGDASYDYKGRIISGGDLVSTYESLNSYDPLESFSSDDFFGMLDAGEGTIGTSLVGVVDIGIGRMPVRNAEQADAMVQKVINYSGYGDSQTPIENCSTTSSINSVYGDWRNAMVFVADDGSDPQGNSDYTQHIASSEDLINTVRSVDSTFNFRKIYFDAYVKESSSAGGSYPDVVREIQENMDRGALILCYIGHGGEAGWADERVLEIQHINAWDNYYRLPFFITGTCEFSRFDDPERVSAGEYAFTNEKGGIIGQLTTTRLVFGSGNKAFTQNFLKGTFDPNRTEELTLGQSILYAKKNTTSNFYNNKRKFFLMGDPAAKLALPKNKVRTLTINSNPVSQSDTIKALMKVTITGEITDKNNQLLSSYNGIIYPTVYDKVQDVKTLNNINKTSIDFEARESIIYKGKATVKDGLFSFSFIVPKDIGYQYGIGRVSYYAANASEDAKGFTESFYIGGSADSLINDDLGPVVDLYLNDSSFVYGGLTDENPDIFATIYDQFGINTVGNGIGHDLVATIDGETSKAIVLNDFYESDLDSYQKGSVKYSLEDVADGKHTLSLKVWDVNNNSTTATTEFVVANSADLALDHVLNYPNPFTTRTQFWFEHNHSCSSIDVQVQVFTVSGRLVKTINETIAGGNTHKPNPIEWDGLDDFGEAIGKGVYIYRLKVLTDDGLTAEKIEKLVVLR